MVHGSVLIVDDEVEFARSYETLLRAKSYDTATAFTAAEARVVMSKVVPDVVLMDMKLPDGNGAELMQELSGQYPDTAFVIVTAHGSIRAAVEATQRGAVDFLSKPVEPEVMYMAVSKALRAQSSKEEVRRLRSDLLGETTGCEDRDFGYPAPATRAAMSLAFQAAGSGGIVLLLGESGTGKDHVARWIHQHSPRAKGPFFAINCAALPRDLAESELFGHEPGAFTGARSRKRGLLELAEGGTLLLDEVGELDAVLQAKLLTFLDTRKIMRVGGVRQIEVSARLIAATNRDLEGEVDNGRFRRDLFYRLNVFPIRLPPLRERLEDLPILIDELFERLTKDLALARSPAMEPGVLELLSSYSWPGNVRELRNVLERALMLSRSGVLRRKHLRSLSNSGEWQLVLDFPENQNLHEVTKAVARKLVAEALRRGGSKQEAANLLGLSRHALAHQIRALGLE